MRPVTLVAFLSAVGAVTAAGAGAPAEIERPPPPNIVFLLTDDQRDGTFGAMGHPWVKTPHVDRLIRDGVRFANTYIAEPSCSPSRTALFSGVHERVNGIGFTSAHRLTEDQWEQTYPALLRQAGYYTGFIGKFGVEYYTFRGQAAEKFDFWRAHDGWARFFPKTAPNCRIYEDSKADIITEVDGDSIQRFLEAAPSDKPFCLSVSFSVPHGSQTSTMHGPADMSVPANGNPKLRGHPYYDTLYRPLPGPIPEDTATDPYRFIPLSVLNQDHGRNTTYVYDYARPTCTEHHVRYYQQISALDQSIGDMMATLQRKGLATNTVILFTSDNGLLMGEYGMGGKSLLYDLASKVPCFIHDPRLPKDRRGRTDTHLVSSLDLTRTILDYAGVSALPHMSGRSLRPLLEQDDAPWREELFLENLLTLRGNPIQEGIRRGNWKYVRFFAIPNRPHHFYVYRDDDLNLASRTPDFEQLFDLDADPGERHNLAATPNGHPELTGLRTACQRSSDEMNRARDAYRRTLPPAPPEEGVPMKRILCYALVLRALSAAAPPNFLWISCEDTSPDLGCYGDAYATTPNLDRLAAQGCRFTRAYSTFPVCAPSRASIITGVHAGTLGAHQMRTGMKHYEAVPPPDVKCFTEYLRAAGYYCSNHTKTDYQFAPPFTAWDALKGDWRNPERRPGQPFFCVINLGATHESQCWDISDVKHDPAKAPLPPFYPDTPNVRKGVARYYDQVERMDRQAGDILKRLEADGLASNTVVFFWGDHGRGLPRYKRWPYETGLRVPLIVRWPGKLEPGSVNEELASLIDLAPTLLSLAGLPLPGHLHGRALLGDGKGAEPPYIFGGRNRMDLTSDDFIRICRDRRFRYIRNFSPEVPYAQEIPYMEKSPIVQEWRRLNAEGKLAGAQKLWFTHPKPAEELYDTEADPFEVNNLAGQPAIAEAQARMRAALEAWMKDTGDLGVVPEAELIERFRPGHQQPVTAAPQITRADDGTVTIACPTPGASIGYRIGKGARWQIYAGPFKAGAAVHAKAIRIGFTESTEVGE